MEKEEEERETEGWRREGGEREQLCVRATVSGVAVLQESLRVTVSPVSVFV